MERREVLGEKPVPIQNLPPQITNGSDVIKSHLRGNRPPNKHPRNCKAIVPLIPIQIAAFLAVTPRNSIEN